MEFRADSYLCSFGSEDTFWEDDGKGGERYLAWLQAKDFATYGAFHIWLEGEIIGQIECGRRLPEDNFGYINLYYLKEDFRGKGYSSQLDQFTNDFLKSLGYSSARLCVSPSNSRAWKYYLKMGWKDLGPRRDTGRLNKASEQLVHYMEKELT